MNIEEIKIELKKRKWTYAKLAKESGLAEGTIKKILGGFAQYPRVDTMNAIVSALNIKKEPSENSESPLENLFIENGINPDKINALPDNIKKLILSLIKDMIDSNNKT